MRNITIRKVHWFQGRPLHYEDMMIPPFRGASPGSRTGRRGPEDRKLPTQSRYPPKDYNTAALRSAGQRDGKPVPVASSLHSAVRTEGGAWADASTEERLLYALASAQCNPQSTSNKNIYKLMTMPGWHIQAPGDTYSLFDLRENRHQQRQENLQCMGIRIRHSCFDLQLCKTACHLADTRNGRAYAYHNSEAGLAGASQRKINVNLMAKASVRVAALSYDLLFQLPL
ncbi:hypothetical protein FKP32DRAFT_675088 [Trametes sanguinea]|nr:hypothetical protein FKP32DRAFT_675088 [Trametes sanguinea]